MKKCMDCQHVREYGVCSRSFEYKTHTDYVTGKTHKTIEVFLSCNTMRNMWPLFGGCGKRGWLFVQKKEESNEA